MLIIKKNFIPKHDKGVQVSLAPPQEDLCRHDTGGRIIILRTDI